MNNYFDNKLVENLISDYKNDNTPETKKQRLKNDIMYNVGEIIKRIIYYYNFSRFEDYEDLFQHASEACFKSIKNFNQNHPRYSSAFNWFSLTAKRSLLNYTIRKKKHRNRYDQDISEFFYLEYNAKELSNLFLEKTLQQEIIFTIDTNFLGQKRSNYIKLTLILSSFLQKTRKFKKTEFYTWARSHGFTNTNCRQYIKDISYYYNKIVEDLI